MSILVPPHGNASASSHDADLYATPTIIRRVAGDTAHYRRSDLAEARATANAIFRAFGLADPADAERWRDLTHRALTILLRAYAHHRECGMFLFRATERVASTYPRLTTATRARARRRGPRAAPEPPVPE